jgi:hypothetical protein
MSQPCMYRVGIKAFIYNEKWEILLTYEDRKWMRDLPWWWLEIGESIIDGLMQEIKEELGENIWDIIVDSNPIYARPCIFDDGFWLFLVGYKVYIDTTSIINTEENQKRAFFSREKLKEIQLYTKPKDINKLFI